jgi:hypothetical protein
MQKNNNSFILVYFTFVKDLKQNFSWKLTKNHTSDKNSKKVGFFLVPT